MSLFDLPRDTAMPRLRAVTDREILDKLRRHERARAPHADARIPAGARHATGTSDAHRMTCRQDFGRLDGLTEESHGFQGNSRRNPARSAPGHG
ncbi:MAG TPA: hypothetical protein PKD10_17615 [Paracoccaceae bacterium]|nr:hypothetical protein [Paracoccaceae bacterium]